MTKPRADAFTVFAHWALVIAVAVSLATGLTIAADDSGSVAGAIGRAISWLLPTGAVLDWHLISGWMITFVMAAYAVFVIRTGKIAKKLPKKRTWERLKSGRGAALAELKNNADDVDRSVVQAWWSALNVALYLFVFVAVGVMAVTGWALYANMTLGLGLKTIATIHGVMAFSFLLFIVGHVAAHVKRGMLLCIFRPKAGYGAMAVIAVASAGVVVGALASYDSDALQTLKIKQAAAAPTLDGDLDEPAWQNANAVVIHTHRGVNLPAGEVDVEVRAVHHGSDLYIAFRWADDTPSSHHLPLVKTADGWRVMQSEFGVNDEDLFYEDKFSVVLSRQNKLGSGTVHLGKGLLPGPHRPTTRGMHFTDDGSLVDMWHWKSVRTGAMEPPLIDDNHFGPPLPSKKPGKRYTGGYGKDPKTGGGYYTNWKVIDAGKPLQQARVTPKYLPTEAPQVLDLSKAKTFEQIAALFGPNVLPHGKAHLWEHKAVKYDPAKDDLPIGSVIPGIVMKGVFEGDRGDVRGAPKWKDGYWTLEARRKLNTGSTYDIPVTVYEPVYLWVSVFNHTQTRHSQHLRPVMLTLD